MNQAGAIAGYALDASGVYHGYLRAPDGTITTFDVPGAGTGGYPQGTTSSNINPAGAIAGLVVDASTVNHGFVRAPDGTVTTFDAPGAGTARHDPCLQQPGGSDNRMVHRCERCVSRLPAELTENGSKHYTVLGRQSEAGNVHFVASSNGNVSIKSAAWAST